MLERMSDFFEKRIDGYDEHMKGDIEWADEFYHYDIPLTVGHEREALLEAGFSSVEVLKRWGATHTLKAVK